MLPPSQPPRGNIELVLAELYPTTEKEKKLHRSLVQKILQLLPPSREGLKDAVLGKLDADKGEIIKYNPPSAHDWLMERIPEAVAEILRPCLPAMIREVLAAEFAAIADGHFHLAAQARYCIRLTHTNRIVAFAAGPRTWLPDVRDEATLRAPLLRYWDGVTVGVAAPAAPDREITLAISQDCAELIGATWLKFQSEALELARAANAAPAWSPPDEFKIEEDARGIERSARAAVHADIMFGRRQPRMTLIVWRGLNKARTLWRGEQAAASFEPKSPEDLAAAFEHFKEMNAKVNESTARLRAGAGGPRTPDHDPLTRAADPDAGPDGKAMQNETENSREQLRQKIRGLLDARAVADLRGCLCFLARFEIWELVDEVVSRDKKLAARRAQLRIRAVETQRDLAAILDLSAPTINVGVKKDSTSTATLIFIEQLREANRAINRADE